ncbi:MAG TPA: porin family protein [Chitinophagaceae bacterium]|jgi:hypothetical protein|nr:porin family protein [Chitinophagaceae bacterium]
MKMKFFTFSATALLLSTLLHAQSGTQLRGGLNLANISVTDNGRVDDAKMLTSFQVGFIKDISLSKFASIQPGVLFTGKGSKTQRGEETSANYYKSTFNPYYIEVPVTLVLKAPLGSGSGFFVGAGPYAAIGVSGKNKVEGKSLGIGFRSERNIDFSNDDPTTLNYEEGAGFGIVKRFDYGLNGTAGIEGKSIVLGANYGLGLAKLQSGGNSSEDHNNKHRILSVFVGIKL